MDPAAFLAETNEDFATRTRRLQDAKAYRMMAGGDDEDEAFEEEPGSEDEDDEPDSDAGDADL